MKHYTFADNFRGLYTKAVTLYTDGQRGAGTFFNSTEQAWLAANGITAQHLYDYAEDEVGGQEPGYDIALGIELVRRDYFINEQGGKPSNVVLDESTLPSKSEAARGITWLPRILPKARAKLRGELPPSLMYCCGGDRRFFQANDIHPHEFLSSVWRSQGNDEAIIDWVYRRTKG